MAPPPRPPPDLTVTTAARWLGLHRRTVLRWIHTGKIDATPYVSGQWRVSRRAVEQMLTTTRHTR